MLFLTCRASVASKLGALMSSDKQSHPGESVDNVETIANVSTVLNCFSRKQTILISTLGEATRSDNRRLRERAAFRIEVAGTKYRRQDFVITRLRHQRNTTTRKIEDLASACYRSFGQSVSLGRHKNPRINVRHQQTLRTRRRRREINPRR
jgi:hypothetical protein